MTSTTTTRPYPPRWLREHRRTLARYAPTPQRYVVGIDPATTFGAMYVDARLTRIRAENIKALDAELRQAGLR